MAKDTIVNQRQAQFIGRRAKIIDNDKVNLDDSMWKVANIVDLPLANDELVEVVAFEGLILIVKKIS